MSKAEPRSGRNKPKNKVEENDTNTAIRQNEPAQGELRGKRKRADKKQEKKSLALAEEKRILGKNLSFAAAEAYKLLRANILFALPDEQKCRIIGITSSCSGEGKSTTAMNLAYMLAEAQQRVLLVEADMRLPTAARRLELKNGPGLSNLLAGLCSSQDAVQDSGIQEKLKVIVSGDIPPNPSELLGTDRMRRTLEELSEQFDFILLDLPPVTAVSDALVVSKLTNGMIMVVRESYVKRSSLADAMRQLQYADAKVLGFVMTHSDAGRKGGRYRSRRRYGYSYGYDYGYGYGEKSRREEAKL